MSTAEVVCALERDVRTENKERSRRRTSHALDLGLGSLRQRPWEVCKKGHRRLRLLSDKNASSIEGWGEVCFCSLHYLTFIDRKCHKSNGR